MMMPATREVLLHNVGGLVLREDAVDLVLLPPEQRLGEHLSCLLHVEVAGAQEAEQCGVTRNLVVEEDGRSVF